MPTVSEKPLAMPLSLAKALVSEYESGPEVSGRVGTFTSPTSGLHLEYAASQGWGVRLARVDNGETRTLVDDVTVEQLVAAAAELAG